MSRIPQYNDPYLNSPVYGNILDTVDSPTYNARLYMLREAQSVSAPDGVADTSDKLIAAPADTVILAQTGVTGTVIDDIVIESLLTTEGPNTVGINFTVKQPGAASFLDQIQMAKAYLGQPNVATPTVFLEIRFQGREADLDDIEAGGNPVTIAGPYRYKLAITNFQVKIDNTGSEYFFETVTQKSYAFRDPVYKLPATFTTVGRTITDHVKDLETKLNNWHKETANNEVADEIKFDLSNLLGAGADGTVGLDKISDESLLTSSQAGAEDVNRVMNETFAIGDAIDHRQALVDAPKDEGTATEPVFEEDKLYSKQGISIERFFATLLSMCPEFYSKITRKTKVDDPKSEVKSDQAYISWFKMDAEVKQLKFDKSRNDYAYQYIYKPRLYKSLRPDVAVDKKENDMSDSDAQSRVQQIIAAGGVKKAYNYLFTGLNDQILNLDLSYDNGIALLVPPKYGALGDFSVTAADKLTSQIPANKDTTLEGVVDDLIDKGKKALEESSLFGFLNDIKDAVDTVSDGLDQLDQFANDLSNLTGLGLDVLKDAIENPAESSARALLDALDSAELSKITTNTKFGGALPPTESSAIPPTYDPTKSAFVYGADLVQAMETPLTLDDLTELNYVKVDEVGEAFDIKQEVQRSQTTENEADAATYKVNSAQNTLFGVLASQHSNDALFLMNVDMSIRGDPWYLGSYGTPESSEESAQFYGDDNCFYLTIRSPVTYDPDYRDEDSTLNSGYWKYDGISRTFSGLFRMVSVTNSFSGGVYTCDVNAQRIIGANKLDKK